MKGWIGGLVVGVVLGSALAAGAALGVPAWQSAAQILQDNSSHNTFRMGYIEGVADTVTAMVTGEPWAFWDYKRLCLSNHQRGTAEEFSRWAVRVWQEAVDVGYGANNAAHVLTTEACI